MRDTTRDVLSRIETLERELGRLKALVMWPSETGDAGSSPADEPAIRESPASRRDLFRYGAAAVGAAAAAGMAASPAEGADGGPVVIGAANTATSVTYLTTANSYGFWAISTNGSYGLLGRAPLVGVYGDTVATASSGAGVVGYSAATTGQAPGVQGISFSPDAPSIFGTNSGGGTAVRAEIPAGITASSSGIAMYALNYSPYTGGAPGAGGFAIYGLSAKGHGLVGATAAPGAAAVVGATNGVVGAYAAAFYGRVIVGGDFTVVGGAKSAAVPHPDGSHRRLYCVESPESWFEDFGRGTLACGEATVALDPDFAAVVDARDYLVFVTANDGQPGLSVSHRTAEGFRVASTARDAVGTFAWRVVAKRKDIVAPRFEPVEIPTEPTLPDVPASVHAPAPSRPEIPRGIVAGRRPTGTSQSRG